MVLRVKHISKRFGGVHAVEKCSFDVPAKQITALIGPNGAGKTTLFNILNGFSRADEGTVWFSNNNITNKRAWQRSRLGMSRTFQTAKAFRNLSLKENLILALRQNDDLFWQNLVRSKKYDFTEEIKTKLAFVGLKKSLETPVIEISYGEQKLFDLARALLNPHTLLLLDEPVAGVNPVVREMLKNVLLKLKKQEESVFLIEHDMDFIRSVADYVVVMDQGSVLIEGKPDEVLSNKRVLEAYLGSSERR
jgi:ABC-type branched-subunit amino acid transport system ATPase component